MSKLFRSTTDQWFVGVFGGIAELFHIDANLLRLGAVFLGIATGGLPLFITYMVAWIVLSPSDAAAH